MERCDALIVGGGPAGSTCARALARAGWRVVVIDRARFPRDKVCGGWITPEVLSLLELDPTDYRAAGLTLQEIRGFRTSVMGRAAIETRYADVASFAVRRCEFDDFLLRRAGVRVLEGTPLTSLRPDLGRWVVNERIESGVIVGAGGHFCPVARYVQGDRDRADPVVAKEAEFPVQRAVAIAGDLPELFFCQDLDGYGWCVRKGDYLNVGIGRRTHTDFGRHVQDFVAWLVRTRDLDEASRARWRGHAYYASGAGVRPMVRAGVLLVGDAAGLAYAESGEGIRPAIESGLIAAATLIAAKGKCDAADLSGYEHAMRVGHPPRQALPVLLRPMLIPLGRVLLRSRLFTRRVVLDRWFLRPDDTELTPAARAH